MVALKVVTFMHDLRHGIIYQGTTYILEIYCTLPFGNIFSATYGQDSLWYNPSSVSSTSLQLIMSPATPLCLHYHSLCVCINDILTQTLRGGASPGPRIRSRLCPRLPSSIRAGPSLSRYISCSALYTSCSVHCNTLESRIRPTLSRQASSSQHVQINPSLRQCCLNWTESSRRHENVGAVHQYDRPAREAQRTMLQDNRELLAGLADWRS